MLTTELLYTVICGSISAALVTGCYLAFKLYGRRSRAAKLQVRTVRYMNIRLVR